jgi:hypothetical protein
MVGRVFLEPAADFAGPVYELAIPQTTAAVPELQLRQASQSELLWN